MANEKFDVIVVGAGAAGLGAAYTLAKRGFSVVVLERGERVGAKMSSAAEFIAISSRKFCRSRQPW